GARDPRARPPRRPRPFRRRRGRGRQRPARGFSPRSGAERAVLHAARRHPRDPPRHHRTGAWPQMTDTIVLDVAERLFADQATGALVNAAETGTWPRELWRLVEEAGFADALGETSELGGVVDAVAILRAAGRHAAPLPLAETMLARFALAAASLPAPAGPLALAPVERDDVLTLR